MNHTISEIKPQPAIQNVEHAFVADFHGQDVLLLTVSGNTPIAYRLPTGFLERLEKARKPQDLFPLGKILITPAAIEALNESEQIPTEFLKRHQKGDWGEVCDVDRNENDFSVKAGYRILSAYRTNKGEKIWLITEADRSSTTILLPSEY